MTVDSPPPVAPRPLDPARAEAWKATVETLQRFYSVIIAIALTSALIKLLGTLEQSAWQSEGLVAVVLAVAFLSTIVPFYHGMERHLYETHRVMPELGPGGRPFPLLADIFVFIIEGGLLFAMGRALDNPQHFFVFWSVLLTVDIIWSVVVWRVQRGKRPAWALNNLIWLIVGSAAWFTVPFILSDLRVVPSVQPILTAVVIAVVEVGRSITDYTLNWSFYFPDSRVRNE